MTSLYQYKNKLLENFILFSLFLTIFFSYLDIDRLKSVDEFLVLILSLIMFYKLGLSQNVKLYKEEVYIFKMLLFIGLLGIASNFFASFHHYTPIVAIVSDFIVFYKAFLVYFAVRILNNELNTYSLLSKMSIYAEYVFYILCLILIFDILFEVYPREYRYGLQSYQLFLGGPARYGFAFSFIFMLLFSKYIDKKKWLLLLVLSVGLFSLRVKYFGFVTFVFVLVLFKDYLKRIPRKQLIIYIIIIFIIFFFLFRHQIEFYFSWENIRKGWSRGIILVTSIDVANDFFPLGTGFGTYSSFFSGKYYSWVYSTYHIDHVYGITRDYYYFVADQFWPMILGQFGWIGLIIYALIIYFYILFFIRLLKNVSSKKEKNILLVPLFAIFSMIIDSTSDSIFTQDRAVALFILMALIVNLQKNNSSLT